MSTFLAFVGLATLVGGAWLHGRSIGIRIAAARYVETVEEREERRVATEASGPRRGIRLKTVTIKDN